MERRLKDTLPGGVFCNVSPQRSKTMSAIRGKNTKSTERKLRMALIRAKIPGWKLHPVGIPGNPDLFFPAHNLVIFVDGCFWHGCPKCGHVPRTNTKFWGTKIARNKERDRLNVRAIRKAGMKVMRIWEHSLADGLRTLRVIEKIKTHVLSEEPPSRNLRGLIR